MTKKLYEVHVEFTYYAMSESRMGAESLCSQAFRDEDWARIADAHEVTSKHQHLQWTGDCLVYGANEDTTLDSALAALGLPSAADIKAAWVAKMTAASRQASNASDHRADAQGESK
jgi:hypothetical protein